MTRCIVVSGLPCAGKSTLARALAARYQVALLAKDAYKEALFGRFGAGDRRWSACVSLLAWDLLLAETTRLLLRGTDCVIEGNFRGPQARVLAVLEATTGARFVEVRCLARTEILLARYRARAIDGSRHPGHVDLEALPELEHELAGVPVAVFGARSVLDCDTSDGLDVEAIVARLGALAPCASALGRGIRGSASCRPPSRRDSCS